MMLMMMKCVCLHVDDKLGNDYKRKVQEKHLAYINLDL